MKKLLMGFAVSALAFCAQAEEPAVPAENPSSAFNLALWSPCQTADPCADVTGLGITIFWAECQDLNGLELGLVGNMVKGDLKGAQGTIGFNLLDGNGWGLQWCYGFNIAEGSFHGWQDSVGANVCKADLFGFQTSCSNYANVLHGVQVGFVNTTHDCHGLQLGLINLTEQMSGIQIGVLNFIKDSPLPFFPIANAKF